MCSRHLRTVWLRMFVEQISILGAGIWNKFKSTAHVQLYVNKLEPGCFLAGSKAEYHNPFLCLLLSNYVAVDKLLEATQEVLREEASSFFVLLLLQGNQRLQACRQSFFRLQVRDMVWTGIPKPSIRPSQSRS